MLGRLSEGPGQPPRPPLAQPRCSPATEGSPGDQELPREPAALPEGNKWGCIWMGRRGTSLPVAPFGDRAAPRVHTRGHQAMLPLSSSTEKNA